MDWLSVISRFLQWPGILAPAYEMTCPTLLLLDLSALSVCAVTGVLAARGKGIDLFGISVIAVVSSVGGGTLRDMCLGYVPVFWVQQPYCIALALLVALLTFFLNRHKQFSASAFLYPDAFGLALFTVAGAEKALAGGHGWFVSVLMGVMTGVFGGMIRDVLCREIPSVLTRTELYATASIAGAVIFVALRGVGVATGMCILAGIAVVFLFRILAVRLDIRLPVIA